MKKLLLILLTALLSLAALTACSQESDGKSLPGTKTVGDILNRSSTEEPTSAPTASPHATGDQAGEPADIDLTQMNATMVYSQVSQLMSGPQRYHGDTVRMSGTMASAEYKGKVYYACIIKDATACCAQGIEFVLTEGDYPPDGAQIVVYGVFDSYEEEGRTYCQLIDAKLES